MPFSIQTKTEMFIRCGRLCCLCLKQCGTNIEAAHITDEAQGGPNDAENGIPVCLDCHQEIGTYNDAHPKGNKLRSQELKARRDRVYHQVETGVIYAQIVAERARSARADAGVPVLGEPSVPPKLSAEAIRFLRVLLSSGRSIDAPARKLSLLNEQDRAQILDELLRNATDHSETISVIARIVQSSAFPREQAVLLIEQVVRATTLHGDVRAKAELLRALSADVLGSVYKGLRLALFEDLIGIVERDQYVEVNEIVPALIGHVSAIPEELHEQYVLALLHQGRSNSYAGAPAARRALSSLPEDVAKAGIDSFDPIFLSWNSRYDHVKHFADRYKHLAAGNQRPMLEDLVTLSNREFVEKHIPDDIF